jgi:hypothetical protein
MMMMMTEKSPNLKHVQHLSLGKNRINSCSLDISLHPTRCCLGPLDSGSRCTLINYNTTQHHVNSHGFLHILFSLKILQNLTF